jgi:uncharacterized protein (TIGR02099 family)
MSTRPLNTFGWIAWFAALAALATLSWTVFPQWAPEVPTLAVFASVVSAIVLLARRIARKVLRWLAVTSAVCVGIVGTLLLVFQLAIARVPEQRVQLQEWLSEKTKLSIEFSRLNARLRLYGPELAFADVTVRTPDRTRVLATASGGSVAFDIWYSLRTGRLTAGRFTLDSPQLGLIRTSDGRIQIAGHGALMEDTKPFAVEDLPVGSFRVRDASISFRDEATGRGPWSVSGVSFVLVREPQMLELSGNASLPSTLGGELSFSARAAGALESPEQVASSFTAQGSALDLASWAEFFPERWPKPQSGHGSIELAATFVGHRTQTVTVDARFDDLSLATPAWAMPIPTADPLVPASARRRPDTGAAPAPEDATVGRQDEQALLSYDRVRLIGRAQRADGGWSVEASTLELDAADVPGNKAMDWRARELAFAWSRPAEGAFSAQGRADVVQLHSLTPFLAYLPESEALARVRALGLRGTVRDLNFNAEKQAADMPLAYSVAASVDAIGFDAVARVPGATGISGVIEANERDGLIRLDTGPLNMSFPWMFRWPLDANAIRGVIAWHNDGESLRIESDKLEFDANDGKGEARLTIEIPRDGSSPLLEILADARDLNAASTPKYLPVNLLTEEPLAWLDRAFVGGRVPRASLELRGPARSFPFRHEEGLFLVKGFVEDVTFDYQPGWMPATQLTGNIEFRNEGMHANGMTARIGGLQVTEASGGFADFKESVLKIAAAATGDLSAGLRFLQSSPIGDALGETFQDLRGTGVIQSQVNLLLPIKDIESRRIAVTTKLNDATVRLVGLQAPVTQLSGSLIVRQQLPVEADLHGEFLGGPVEVTITPDDNTDETATLVARGHTTAEKLAEFTPASVGLEGALDWRMTTYLSSRPDRGRQVYAIESAMTGLGIRLPYPAGKEAAATRPLRVELEHDARRLLVRTAFGSLRGLLQFSSDGRKWSFDRGGVRADGVLAALPDHRGLRLEGKIDRLRLDEWFALGERQSGNGDSRSAAGTKVSDVLRAANVHVGLLQLYGFEWPDVRGVLEATEAGWRVDVTGSNAEGRLLIPENFKGSAPLSIDLERLIVMRSDRRGSDSSDESAGQDPREWPSLAVHIGDMHVENHPIGGVELTTTRIDNGMRIDRLAIAQDAVQAEAQGDWIVGPQGERSSLVAKITSTDVRATLRALNYTEFLEAERAEVSAQLSWPGGFDGNLVKRASGSIAVSADSGQLLILQPGAGRVLGLFSVAALPRRLALDFSDLTEKGLSFDSIRGDFELKEGNAYTNNLLLRGPAAEIGIAGRTGLGTQDFDQTAVVTGNLGASIPVAGVLAGGPAVGAALLLFSQVFKEPLKGIARGYYRITGTWDNPVVERVDAAEAKAGS